MSSVLREHEQRREAEADAIAAGRLAAQEHPKWLRKTVACIGLAAIIGLGACIEYDHKLPVSFSIDSNTADR